MLSRFTFSQVTLALALALPPLPLTRATPLAVAPALPPLPLTRAAPPTPNQGHTHMEGLLKTVVQTLQLARLQQGAGSAEQMQLVLIVSDGRRSPSWGGSPDPNPNPIALAQT